MHLPWEYLPQVALAFSWALLRVPISECFDLSVTLASFKLSWGDFPEKDRVLATLSADLKTKAQL